jgi:glycosyltransferase involved in cell wall biosynthesis
VQFAKRANVEHTGNLTIVSLRQASSSRFRKFARMPIAVVRICREVARFRPDHVVLEGGSWAVYLALVAWALRKTLPGVRIVYHAHNVEYLLRLERDNRIVAALTRRAEWNLLAVSHRSFAVSEEDRQRFSALYGVLPMLLPNALDCSASRTTPERVTAARERYRITGESILFMGFYEYPPNRAAVDFLMNEVMPWLRRRRPSVELVVTGGTIPYSAPWLINPGVVGREEFNAILGACRIGVAPIFSGSGTRLKILEYMAAGLPVVATRKGAEGLGVQPGVHALYAETAEEFGEAILRLLDDRGLAEQLSLEGAALVRAKFDWVPILSRFASQLANS